MLSIDLYKERFADVQCFNNFYGETFEIKASHQIAGYQSYTTHLCLCFCVFSDTLSKKIVYGPESENLNLYPT